MQNPTTQIDDETYFPTHFSEAIFSGVVLRVKRTELQDDSATKMAIFLFPPIFLTFGEVMQRQSQCSTFSNQHTSNLGTT